MNRELWQLAVQGLRRKKRSSVLLLFVLFLSLAFAVITLSITSSINKTNRELRKDTYGTWYGVMSNGTQEDAAILRECEWLDTLGISHCYGSTEGGEVGTVDGALRSMGRLALRDGRFPETEHEIAMEADMLSALGYPYELGQELCFSVNVPAVISAGTDALDTVISVERTYTLVGVLREYTSLWSWEKRLEESGGELCSAIITEEAAQQLLQGAKDRAQEMNEGYREHESDATIQTVDTRPTFFFSVAEEFEDITLQEIMQSLTIAGSRGRVRCNIGGTSASSEEKYNYFYIGMIFLVTLIAVVCIYIVQLQKQVRQVALFRSIGITRRQLRLLLLFETLLLCLPAIVLGILGGALGVWVLLRLLMYTGSVTVLVDIPYGLLVQVVLLWMAGIILVRVAVFQLALREPLTGRFGMEQRKARRYHGVRRAAVAFLSSLLCAILIFTVLESASPVFYIRYWSNTPSYNVMSDFAWRSILDKKDHQMITKDVAARLGSTPGITRMDAYGQLDLELRFTGAEENSLYTCIWESDKKDKDIPAFPEGIRINFVAVTKEGWEQRFQGRVSSMDWNDFQKGNQVIMTFYVDSQNEVVSFRAPEYQRGQGVGLDVGDTVTLGVYGTGKSNIRGHRHKIHEFDVQIGDIVYLNNVEADFGGAGFLPYTIYCSEQFLEQELAELKEIKPGYVLEDNNYLTGGAFGYNRVNLYTDLTAGYMSTDYVLAQLCAANHLTLANNREAYAAYLQEYLQTLILLLSGGISIALILMLLIGNTLALEAQSQCRNYGILQSLGMSRRQMRWQLRKKALTNSMIALVSGWIIYIVYLMLSVWSTVQSFRQAGMDPKYWIVFYNKLEGMRMGGIAWWSLLLISFGAVFALMLLARLAKRGLFREKLMDKLRDER